MDVRKRNNQNRLNGAAWEHLFDRRARFCGFLPIKNPLSARIVGPKKIIPIRSNLDWTVIQKGGRVAYFDTKCFDGRFGFSEINPKQLEKAITYENWGVTSGFIVWFRDSDRVAHFSGKTLISAGPRTGFTPEMGLLLGQSKNFDLNLVFNDED